MLSPLLVLLYLPMTHMGLAMVKFIYISPLRALLYELYGLSNREFTNARPVVHSFGLYGPRNGEIW